MDQKVDSSITNVGCMHIDTEMMNLYLVFNCFCEEYQNANIIFPIINLGLTMVAILDFNSANKYIISLVTLGKAFQ